MDGVSAAASVIALVQAGGMLLKVGKAFHETFISKDNDHRADDASLRVASTEEFIQKIELFQAIKLISSPTITSSAPTSGQHATAISATPGTGPNSPPQPGIDHVLKNCKEQLSRLQVKVRKMIVPRDAKKFKRLVGAVRLKLNEPEFAQIDATIMLLLQQLTFFMTMAQFQLSQDSHASNQERHDELLRRHQLIASSIQSANTQTTNYQKDLLSELQRTMEDQRMKHEMQVDVFEQGHRMILSSLEKLSISPRLDRSASSLSGTTVTSETEPIDGEDLIAPIAPGLIKYPGIPFGGDRSSNPKVPKRVLDRVDEWFVTTDHDLSCLHIHMHDHDDAMHDLCNRILQDIVNSGRWPICYNGLPRDGPPPAPGWYTMTHAIWWLSGQLYIPVPHKDGHMPSRGYDPNVELIIERLEKQVKTTPFIVLYLLERSCPTDSDLRLYELLINRLIEISHTSRIKLLIFSGVSNGVALGHLPGSVRVDNPEQNGEIIALAEWDCKIADNDDDDDKDEEGDNSMVENESSY